MAARALDLHEIAEAEIADPRSVQGAPRPPRLCKPRQNFVQRTRNANDMPAV